MQDRYRLPRTVVPSRYDLTIEPDLEAATFAGQVDVVVEVQEAVESIVLNALELQIDRGWLVREDGDRIEVDDVVMDEETQRAQLGSDVVGRHRPVDTAPGVPGDLERPAARLLSLHLHGRRRADAHDRHHAVRGGGRPARVPLLGRARPQGGVRDHRGRARRPRGRLVRSRDRPRTHWRGQGPGAVRRHHEHVHLPGGLRGGPAGDHRGRRGRWGADPRGPRARQGPPHRFRSGCRGVLHAVLQRVLRVGLPGQEGRHDRPARLRARRHGEHRLHHIPRIAAARRPRAGYPARAGEHRRRGGARAGSPMVRQSGHHAVVERHLAQRGVRHVHGTAHDRRMAARLGALVLVRALLHRGQGGRCAPFHSRHRVPGAFTRRHRGHVRRAHVSEGCGHPAHARPLPGPGEVPRRDPSVSAAPCLRQHRDPRPVGRTGGGQRRAGAADHGRMDLAGRLPAAHGHP